MIEVIPVRDNGLGNTSHLIDLGDGSALVVDPERDPRPYLDAAHQNGLVIRHVAETHLHADFVSGAGELVVLGASLIAPHRSRLARPFRGVEEGDELAVGDLTLQVLETPGHTPEHVSYLLSDGTRPEVLLSGGTLMAGGVARPDLISDEDTVPLAGEAYRSVRRLLGTLPGDVEIRPTHGGGSFCSSADAPRTGVTTIGEQRLVHPAMGAVDEEAFVDELLGGLGSYPPYFLRLREFNRQGPHVYGVDLPRLTGVGVENLGRYALVDVRPIDRYARGHIPGSVSIELRDGFNTWLGWLFEPDTGIVFVLDSDQDERDLVSQALNVGYENLVGRVDVADWTASGRRLSTIDLIPPDGIDADARILDIRQTSEWASRHVPGALHVELGDVASHPERVEPGMVVHCGQGQRAMTAASLLMEAGIRPGAVTTAGAGEIEDALSRQ